MSMKMKEARYPAVCAVLAVVCSFCWWLAGCSGERPQSELDAAIEAEFDKFVNEIDLVFSEGDTAASVTKLFTINEIQKDVEVEVDDWSDGAHFSTYFDWESPDYKFFESTNGGYVPLRQLKNVTVNFTVGVSKGNENREKKDFPLTIPMQPDGILSTGSTGGSSFSLSHLEGKTIIEWINTISPLSPGSPFLGKVRWAYTTDNLPDSTIQVTALSFWDSEKEEYVALPESAADEPMQLTYTVRYDQTLQENQFTFNSFLYNSNEEWYGKQCGEWCLNGSSNPIICGTHSVNKVIDYYFVSQDLCESGVGVFNEDFTTLTGRREFLDAEKNQNTYLEDSGEVWNLSFTMEKDPYTQNDIPTVTATNDADAKFVFTFQGDTLDSISSGIYYSSLE